ncbi:MAG: hypothetical protein J6U68_00145 [Clostridia bacterium]|nr:hypothetical protein [Clostridia bacterium]
MANKKPSGLGRGLGELLDDNTPDIREGRSKVTVLTEGDVIKITPEKTTEIGAPKALFETPKKNKSVKANFKK